jgi:hypothetical protein
MLTPLDKDLIALRESWCRGEFKEDYRILRPMVERSIAWTVADTPSPGPFPLS